VPGDKGSTGVPGDKGSTGERGNPGYPGDQGLTGLSGAVGADGLQGHPGPQGNPGNPGDQGEKGEKGDSYATTYHSLINLTTLTTGDIKTFVIALDLSYTSGQEVLFGITGTSTDRFTGDVISYSPISGELVLSIQSVRGTGSSINWEVNINGSPGKEGIGIIDVNIKADGRFIFLRSDGTIITTATSIFSLLNVTPNVTPTKNFSSSMNDTSLTCAEKYSQFVRLCKKSDK
jgi:hypothetical protein